MSKKSSKKKKQPVIPKELKSNLTTSMRSELAEETFENAPAVGSTPSDILIPTSSVSEASTQKSERVQKTTLCPERDRTIQYENDLLSVYEGTAGTISFESLISAGEETEREAEATVQEENKLKELKRIPIRRPTWKKEETVGEKEFIEGKLLPGMVEEIQWKRGEPEMDFVQNLIEDINQLVASSGRTDVLLEHSIQFEASHLPVLRVRLGKKSEERKQDLEREELEMEERLLEDGERAKPAEDLYFGDILGAVNNGLAAIL